MRKIAPRHGPAGHSAGRWTHGGVSYVSYAPAFVWVPQQFPIQEAMGSRAHESHDRGATLAMNAHDDDVDIGRLSRLNVKADSLCKGLRAGVDRSHELRMLYAEQQALTVRPAVPSHQCM